MSQQYRCHIVYEHVTGRYVDNIDMIDYSHALTYLGIRLSQLQTGSGYRIVEAEIETRTVSEWSPV